MARVVWSPEALAQLRAIIDYIQLFDPAAANRLAERLVLLGEGLSVFPHKGRPAVRGTREIVTVRPYIMRYDVQDDEVRIISIRHGAQLPDD